jgi:glycosyltransferase involved in cell wall biosynthesis
VLGRSFLHGCEVLAAYTPSQLITDARTVQDYYWERYRRRSEMIAYGADVAVSTDHLALFGLSSRKYILYVARLEPENNPELVIRAYRDVRTDWPLVIVGGNPYQPSYEEELRSIADERVIFTGPVYGDAYWGLQKNAGIFVFAGEIGGIHPALVEAMAAGNAILYIDTPANSETVRGAATPFLPAPHELAARLAELLAAPEDRERLRKEAQRIAEDNYTWDAVVTRYEALFRRLLH